jgi:predicted nucleotidyltransferase
MAMGLDGFGHCFERRDNLSSAKFPSPNPSVVISGRESLNSAARCWKRLWPIRLSRIPCVEDTLCRGYPDASRSNLRYTAGMERDQAIARLKEHEAELRQLGIEHLYLFGSTARGEAREDSDVDLFFDHPVGSIGLYELMDVKETASRILGRKADIMTRRSLHRVLRDRIEASALQVF